METTQPPARLSDAKQFAPAAELTWIEYSKLDLDPANVRLTYEDIDGLAASLTEVGILQPLLVEPNPDGRFLVIDGNRRYKAAGQAQLAWVPVQIRSIGERKVSVQLIANLQRSDLSAFEMALALEEGLKAMPAGRDKAEELGRQLGGKSGNWVTRHTALLKLDPQVTEALKRHRLGIKSAALVARQSKISVQSAVSLAAQLRSGEAKASDKRASVDSGGPTEVAPRTYERKGAGYVLRAVFTDLSEAKEAALRADLDQIFGRYGSAK